jgi:hypothetical protein
MPPSASVPPEVQSPYEACVAQTSTHAPPEQVVPVAHTVPHAPQFWLSLVTSAQTDAPASLVHVVWPAGQALTHAPFAHICPAVGQRGTQVPLWQVPPAHETPHAPQFVALVWVFTHDEPHAAKPGAHVLQSMRPSGCSLPAQVGPLLDVAWHAVVHAPPAQSMPVPHAWPQLPQFAGSLWVSAHVVPHAVYGAAHEPVQKAPWQKAQLPSHAALASYEPASPAPKRLPMVVPSATKPVLKWLTEPVRVEPLVALARGP